MAFIGYLWIKYQNSIFASKEEEEEREGNVLLVKEKQNGIFTLKNEKEKERKIRWHIGYFLTKYQNSIFASTQNYMINEHPPA